MASAAGRRGGSPPAPARAAARRRRRAPGWWRPRQEERREEADVGLDLAADADVADRQQETGEDEALEHDRPDREARRAAGSSAADEEGREAEDDALDAAPRMVIGSGWSPGRGS